MKFSIVVHSAPYSRQASQSALNFAEALLASGHSIYRLFFFGDGVHNASSLVIPPQDEIDIPAVWQALIERHGIDAVVCVSSALKRGVINKSEANRYELNQFNLREGFTISGLGQLIDATTNSDRVINFG